MSTKDKKDVFDDDSSQDLDNTEAQGNESGFGGENLSEEDQRKLIEKYDVESRYRNVVGWTKKLVSVMAIALSFIALYTAGFGLPPEWIHRCVYLTFVLSLVFILYPINPGASRKPFPLILDGGYALIGASFISIVTKNLLEEPGAGIPVLFVISAIILFYFKIRTLLKPLTIAVFDIAISGIGLVLLLVFTLQYFKDPTIFTDSTGTGFKLFLSVILLLLFFVLGRTFYSSIKKFRTKDVSPLAPEMPTYFDWVCAILSVAFSMYIIVDYEEIIFRAGDAVSLDFLIGAIAIGLVLEATRRSVGTPLPVIGLLALMVAFYGRSLAGVPVLHYFAHRGYSVSRIIEHMYLGTEGIYGVPTGVVATYVFHFVLFGLFISKTGLGQLFIDLAMSLAGWSAGGPAKVAVISSGFLGMISGSSVANTVTTGAFTIPLMKRVGYKPNFAGAVEASASTGGQITPPIMGAAAFIMAEFLQIPYLKIAICAILPALVHYFSVIAQIHLEAVRSGIKGVPRDQLPKTSKLLRENYLLLLPLVLIVYLLLIGRTPFLAAFWAILLSVSQGQVHDRTKPFLYTILLSFPFMAWLEMPDTGMKFSVFWIIWLALFAYGCWKTWKTSDKVAVWTALALDVLMVLLVLSGTRIFYAAFFAHLGIIIVGMCYKETNMNFHEFLDAMDGGARNALSIGAAVATVGFIVGTTVLTGLGLKFSQITIDMSSGLANIIQPVFMGLLSSNQLMLFFTLAMTGVACIILGMGVPTTAQYIITSMIAAPAISQILPDSAIPSLIRDPEFLQLVKYLLSHMFVLYYGILADVTPPVALAAYAASGISGGNAFKTGFFAFYLSLGKAMVPFFFIYTPSLLLMPWLLNSEAGLPIFSLIGTLFTLCMGIIALSCSFSGYFADNFKWFERPLFFLIAVCFFAIEFWSSLLAVVLMAVMYFWQKKRRIYNEQQPVAA